MANRNPSGKWKPGQSGNPKGRPKSGFSLSELLKQKLDEPIRPGSKITKKEALVSKLIREAHKGDKWFEVIKFIFERTEGTLGPETLLRITADDLSKAQEELKKEKDNGHNASTRRGSKS